MRRLHFVCPAERSAEIYSAPMSQANHKYEFSKSTHNTVCAREMRGETIEARNLILMWFLWVGVWRISWSCCRTNAHDTHIESDFGSMNCFCSNEHPTVTKPSIVHRFHGTLQHMFLPSNFISTPAQMRYKYAQQLYLLLDIILLAQRRREKNFSCRFASIFFIHFITFVCNCVTSLFFFFISASMDSVAVVLTFWMNRFFFCYPNFNCFVSFVTQIHLLSYH